MNATYEVIEGIIVKKYSNGDCENLCLLSDVEVIINRTRETLDRMEAKLSSFIKKDENSALSIMFHDYVKELNELKKIKLLNN